VLLVLLAVVVLPIDVGLLVESWVSSRDPCPTGEGGAVLDVSGEVTMQHAVFVAEDDNCLWDPRPGMYVEFDGPAAVSFGGPTRVGSSPNTTFDLWAGTPIVAYTTDLHENKHACTIEVEVSTSDRSQVPSCAAA